MSELIRTVTFPSLPETGPSRRGFLIGLAGLSLAATRGGRALAQRARDPTPLLIDLPGWEGEPVSAANFAAGLMVQREYTRDDAHILATIEFGALSPATAFAADPVFGPAEGRTARVLDGFTVETTRNTEENSGTIVVRLVDDQRHPAVFRLEYDSLTESEALDVARQFDWPALQAIARP